MAIHNLTNEQIDELYEDIDTKVEVAKASFFHFLTLYLPDSFELAPADFHKEMIDALDSVDDINRFLDVMGFRGCAKSTILEAFAIWSLLNGRHNYIVWIGNTMDDSKESLANIKAEIEDNEDLRFDFNIRLATDEGEVKESNIITKKWSEKQLIIGNCTIVAKSRLGKVRGKKFKKARIDLIICDDLEDIKTADTAEKRAETRKWFYTEVLQATKQGVLATDTKVVMLGNLVHRDCLVVHFGKNEKVKSFRFPLLNDKGEITWKALYPDMEAVEEKRQEVLMAGEGLGHVIWAREYLLKDADEEDMVLHLSDIQYYPDEWLQRKAISAGVGIDFAISKKESADYTAMCKGVDVNNDEGERRLLIMKNNIEKRLGFDETIKKAVEINSVMPHGTKFYPEKVGYQEAAHEIMRKNGLTVTPMPATSDKKSRIQAACFYIKNGRVLFPREGAENVINNLIGFGIEEHDDLADAFAYLVLGMIKRSGGIILG